MMQIRPIAENGEPAPEFPTRRRWLVAGCMLVAVCAAGPVSATTSGRSGHSDEIVYVSPVAAPVGGIDALAPDIATHDLTPPSTSPAGLEPLWLGIAPGGRRIVYWGYAGSKKRLFVARDDGRVTRVLKIPGAGSAYSFQRAAFSSDGSSILVEQASWASGRAALELIDLGSGTMRRVGSRSCFAPVEWSPDRELLACASGPQRSAVLVFDLVGHLRFRAAAPKSQHEAAAFWSSDGLLAVSTDSTRVVGPEGRSIAFVRGAAQGWASDGETLILSRPGSVISYDVVNRRTTLLMRRSRLAPPSVTITPDGRSIVAQDYPSTRVRISAIDGGRTHSLRLAALATASLSDIAFVASRQGRYAYVRPGAQGNAAEIVVGALSGGAPRVVGRFPYNEHFPGELAWLPDGSRVLYDWTAPPPDDLWSMRPDGSGRQRLTDQGEDISDPAWSPDGEHIAYVASTFEDGRCVDCPSSVVLSDASADPRSQVILGRGIGVDGEGAPSWSPTGGRLVVETSAGEDRGLSIVTPGERPDPLTTTGTSPAWSPDGQRIAYLDASGISVIRLSDRVESTLVPGDAKHPVTSVSWSPDATTIAFTTGQGLYLTDADGSQAPRAIYPRAAHRASFSPDGQRLVFDGGPTGDGDTIYTVERDGSALRAISVGADPAWRP